MQLLPSPEAVRDFAFLLRRFHEACQDGCEFQSQRTTGDGVDANRFRAPISQHRWSILLTLASHEGEGFDAPFGWSFSVKAALAKVKTAADSLEPTVVIDWCDGKHDPQAAEQWIASLGECIATLEEAAEKADAEAHTEFETVFPSFTVKPSPDERILVASPDDEASASFKGTEALEPPASPPTEPKPIEAPAASRPKDKAAPSKPRTKRRYKKGELDLTARNLLLDRPDLTNEEIAALLGCNESTLRNPGRCPKLAKARATLKQSREEYHKANEYSDRR